MTFPQRNNYLQSDKPVANSTSLPSPRQGEWFEEKDPEHCHPMVRLNGIKNLTPRNTVYTAIQISSRVPIP